jgi:hypothetical protein
MRYSTKPSWTTDSFFTAAGHWSLNRPSWMTFSVSARDFWPFASQRHGSCIVRGDGCWRLQPKNLQHLKIRFCYFRGNQLVVCTTYAEEERIVWRSLAAIFQEYPIMISRLTRKWRRSKGRTRHQTMRLRLINHSGWRNLEFEKEIEGRCCKAQGTNGQMVLQGGQCAEAIPLHVSSITWMLC